MLQRASTQHPCRRAEVRRRSGLGFTLIEVMITVAIIGILATIAVPAFLDSIRKGRRSDAVAALSQIQQAQERWRANRSTYSADLTSAAPDGLGLSATSASGYYQLSLSDPDDTAYTTGYAITATAASGKSQAADSACQKLVLRWAGGNAFYTSVDAAAAVDSTGAKRCWSR